MSYADKVFVKNCKLILGSGLSDQEFDVRPKWHDGTPAHTVKTLYVQNRYELSQDYIPVMTLRKSGFKNAIDEILWIYQKKSNRLEDLHSHIWDDWDVGDRTIGKAYGYQIGIKSKHHKYRHGEDLEGIMYDYIDGWIYLSQIDAVLWDLKNNPGSRSIMTNTYNHQDLASMGLRPCAYSIMFNVTRIGGENYLNAILYQRSQDTLTANNWNVIQYSVLLHMIAQVVGMKVGTFVHSVADMHIYDRHIPAVQNMINSFTSIRASKSANSMYSNEAYHSDDIPFPNPIFEMDRSIKSFYDFKVEDFNLKDYQYLPFDYKIEVAV